MDTAETRAQRRRIEEEAASLVVDKSSRGDDSAAAAAMLSWAAQSPTHGVALAQAEAAWAAAERLRAVTTRREIFMAQPIDRHSRGPSRRLILTAGVAAAAAAALPVAFGVRRLIGGRRVETGIGEQRRVAIADGSLLHLNTDTAVDLDGEGERQIATIIRGEVMFDLARTAKRPLMVKVGAAVISALGSAFDLELRDSLAELLVERGWVDVLAEGVTHRVTAGGSAAIGSGVVAVTSVDRAVANQRLAWRRGIIDLNGQSLAQAAAEFSRYLKHPIIIADPSLASLRIGGTFATDESASFIAALKQSFPVRAVRTDDGSILLTTASCREREGQSDVCRTSAAVGMP